MRRDTVQPDSSVMHSVPRGRGIHNPQRRWRPAQGVRAPAGASAEIKRHRPQRRPRGLADSADPPGDAGYRGFSLEVAIQKMASSTRYTCLKLSPT